MVSSGLFFHLYFITNNCIQSPTFCLNLQTQSPPMGRFTKRKAQQDAIALDSFSSCTEPDDLVLAIQSTIS